MGYTMPLVVPIQAIANQTLEIVFDQQRYILRIVEILGNMAIDITLNATPLITGARIVADNLTILYPYLRGDGGDFSFSTQANATPYYTEFGLTQFLIYFSADEIS